MKKQTKKTGFHELCALLESHSLSLQEYKELLSITERRPTSSPLDIYMNAGWLMANFAPSEKLKTLVSDVNSLFKPVKKDVIKVPENMVVAYNNLFPQIKIPTSGKYARCNIQELTKAFEWFLKEYGYQWDVILKATYLYVTEKEQGNFNYMRTAKYFIRKQGDNKVWSSDLGDYCMQIVSGVEVEGQFHFPEKVV